MQMSVRDISRDPGTTLAPLDGDRLWATIEQASSIGRWRERGVQRLALSDVDREMRDAFCGWCRNSGLRISVDRVGNIVARRDGAQELAPVMIGSHLDTQVAGGRYDGALGVLTGLEIVRSLDDQGVLTRHPLEIVSWSNEEGARFQPPMLGSAAYAGSLPLAQALAAEDPDGSTFGAELERIGYAGTGPVPGAPPAAYFEFHIEQGDVLDRQGVDLGVVTSAYPSRGLVIRMRGETGHAGATPMRRRHDALLGAAEVAIAVEALARDHGDQARATTTRLDVWPNRPGIIPGEAVLNVDFRHAQESELGAMSRLLDQVLAGVGDRLGVEVRVEESWEFGAGITFDAELAAIARGAAAALGVETIDMPSTAGHDAYSLARVAPALILFAPCVAGVTHNEHEEIEFTRVLRAANVVARSVLEAAGPTTGGKST